jgi:D-sedoheptulose 7-phosphate isomerase
VSHADTFMREVAEIALKIDRTGVERLAIELSDLRARDGTLYLIGLGGSAANCTHAAADFRKLCKLRALAVADNIAEFSARANDEGFDTVFRGFLESWLTAKDVLLVFSVGGGTDTVSAAITRAVMLAKERGAKVLGIVGPNGGETAKHADYCIKVPAPENRQTPHAEAFQAVIWHALVSHPLLQKVPTKW